MSKRMALFRIQIARERLQAARLLLGHRFHHDCANRSYWSALSSAWAYLELREVPCSHSSAVSKLFHQLINRHHPGCNGDVLSPFNDLKGMRLEEETGEFFQVDAKGAAHQYRNAEKILEWIEKAFKAIGVNI